jgi:predicted RNA binding protein YcfA (HicA-like mRNA interferase family)
MPQVPILKSKEVVQILKQIGFVEKRQKGSHLILERTRDQRTIVIPMHPKALGKGLMHAIIKEAGLTVKEFVDLL